MGSLKRQTPERGQRGLDVANGLPYAEFALERDGSLTDRSGLVNNPNTRLSSGTLDGETTRRVSLNPHRGSQPVGTRRVVGKREWQRESVKSRRQRMILRKGHVPCEYLGVFPLYRAESPTEGSGC